tara:strand:- start:2649 stop:2789 length:141 start_codon:yes stop_codon:yes gene_type:complete
MASKSSTLKVTFGKGKKRRKGVGSKNKHSWNKNSKNYVKSYKGQGR